MREYKFFVYILSNASKHPLYTGFTNSVMRRQPEHKEQREKFAYTAKYNLHRLVYFERFQYANNAIAREKQIKRWSRAKKIALIEAVNPKWDDLSREFGAQIDFQAIVVRARLFQENQGPSTPAQGASARDDNS